MKATIRITMIDPFSGRVDDYAIVRVAEITHCVPMRGGFSLIMLTTGNSITVNETIEELEQRIDEAEAEELQAIQS
jgi:hypothetical protein